MLLNLINTFLILLISAVSISWIFWRLKLPIISGYIIVGVILGPQALGWIEASHMTKEIAELGIVLLLFTLGLEFSLSRLFSMFPIVFGYGGLQVATSIVATIGIGLSIGLTWPEAIVISGVVATSSTAIVLKQLMEQKEIHSAHGRNAIGVLLFQDLAVILFLVMIPSLNEDDLLLTLGWAILKGVSVIVIILSLGRWILRPLFHRIAEMKSSEIFMLTTLLVALGCASISYNLGLPLALGAFVAGVMLSETEFRPRLDVEMRPFRDILLAMFFISIGLQFNIKAFPETWPWVFLLFSALIVFKTVIISLLGLLFGNNRIVAFRTGLILAQGSEFGFTILFLANKYHVLPYDYGEVVLGALLMSITVSSFLIRYSERITSAVDCMAVHLLPVEPIKGNTNYKL